MDCSKLAISWKNDNDVIIFQHDITVKFSWRSFVFLVKFSYWSKFYVKINTGSRVMTIFFYKGLTRKQEITNTPVQVLHNIWRLGWVRDTKFDTNVSNTVLLNAAKCQGYSFYLLWLIKGKPNKGDKVTPAPRLRLKQTDENWCFQKWNNKSNIRRIFETCKVNNFQFPNRYINRIIESMEKTMNANINMGRMRLKY